MMDFLGGATEESLKREIAVYQDHLNMALREMRAGNTRMHAFAEAYANRRDSLQFQLMAMQKNAKGK